VSDIDTAAADGLKVLDPKRPIREATKFCSPAKCREGPQADSCTAAINVAEVLMVERLSAAPISLFSILGFLPRNMVRRSAILSTI
jgi:hypothetical protein